MCLPHFWTTHKAYLVVFTGVQNLIVIHAVVSIIWNFEYLLHLAWKCLFMPPKLRLWRFHFTPKCADISTEPPNVLAWKDVIWHTDRQNRSTGVTCVCDEEIKKDKETYSGKLVTCPDHPRRPIEIPFGMVGGLPSVSLTSAERLLSCERSKFSWSHYLCQWLTQQPYSRMAVMSLSCTVSELLALL